MSRLLKIQDAFQRFLLGGDPTIGSHVVGTQRVPVETRLGIYGNGYRLRLIEVLQKSFPVLAQLLDEKFEALAASYVEAHPSTFFNIRWYGDRMAEFLAADAEYSKVPILAEMARWAWAMGGVFDAAVNVPQQFMPPDVIEGLLRSAILIDCPWREIVECVSFQIRAL